MHSSSRHVGVMALLVFGLALGGCGSAESSAPSVPQGANLVAWVDTFCTGLGDVVAEQAAVMKTQPPTTQGQKDALLKLADSTQQSFASTANKLTQLGPPAIPHGKQTQDSAVGFFTTSASTVSDQRAKLEALDTNDPHFAQKASQLASPNGDTTANRLQGVTSSPEVMAAFGKAPKCQRLVTTATH